MGEPTDERMDDKGEAITTMSVDGDSDLTTKLEKAEEAMQSIKSQAVAAAGCAFAKSGQGYGEGA